MTKLWAFAAVCLFAAGLLAAQEHPTPLADVPQTPAKDLSEQLRQGKKVLVIDVRGPKEYAEGHVPGAKNIPLEDLSRKIGEMKVSADTTIVAVCEHGGRSSRAVVELQKLGYKTSSFCTLDSWKKEGLKIEKGNEKPKAESRVYKFICHHYCQSDKQTTDLDQICECACALPYRDCMQGE